MDENVSRGYIQLGKARNANDFRFTNGFSHLSPPVDKFNWIYLALLCAGVGFLLPYNSKISRHNNRLRYVISLHTYGICSSQCQQCTCRNPLGYVVSFTTLLFVLTCEVWWEIFGPSISYTINLVAVAVVALGCTVQQSSFYGYTSMLPSRYTQAVMAGESAAGFLVSVNRIITKLLLDDQKVNTIIFFAMSLGMVALCCALHQVVQRTDFVQFYITLCREARKITLEPTEDVGLMDPSDQGDVTKSQYGVLKLQTSPPATDSATSSSDTAANQYSAFSFSNPNYEPTTGGGPTYKVEDVVIRIRSGYGSNTGNTWGGMKRGMMARWEVAKSIWPYMLSIGLAYFITLCLYPGIESEVVSCRFGTWMPVILMAVFNGSDLIGKMLASIPYDWSRTQLIVFAWGRAVFVPLLLMCATPRGSPLIPGEGYPILFSMLLGITNGLIGSVPMIQAPSRVAEDHRELTGNIMTLSYNVGLTGGSLVAYVLDAIIGPPLENNGCYLPRTVPIVTSFPPTSPLLPTVLSTLGTVTNATIASTLLLSSTLVGFVTQSNLTDLVNVTASVLPFVNSTNYAH